MRSRMYPRTIAISRPTESSSPGLQSEYSHLDPANEALIQDGIPANIQLLRQGQSNGVGLPSDGRQTVWRIFFKGPLGLLQESDRITDDLGVRYQVIGPYWNVLGYNALCERLEA